MAWLAVSQNIWKLESIFERMIGIDFGKKIAHENAIA